VTVIVIACTIILHDTIIFAITITIPLTVMSQAEPIPLTR
jgi:hypothetical protein